MSGVTNPMVWRNQVSPTAHGIQGGSSAWFWGVMRSKQRPWNTWLHGSTATVGRIFGMATEPSGLNERSLLHK